MDRHVSRPRSAAADIDVDLPEPGWIDRFAELWEELGPETRTAIVDLLPHGWSFEGKRVMDFGCGAGRTLQALPPEAQTAEIWGVDIDATSIDLLRETVCPPLHVMRSDYMPPLELESGSFDLIWSISVFTHLTDNSLPWLLRAASPAQARTGC